MDIQKSPIEVVGIFTITFTDQSSGLTRLVEKKQIITGLKRILYNSQSLPISTSKLLISSTKVFGGNPDKLYMYTDIAGSSVVGTNTHSVIDYSLDDFWVENVWRFPSTGTTQDINSIGISRGSSTSNNEYNRCLNYVHLDTTYTQQPNELVDIKYRVIFKMPSNIKVAHFIKRRIIEQFYNVSGSATNNSTILVGSLGRTDWNEKMLGRAYMTSITNPPTFSLVNNVDSNISNETLTIDKTQSTNKRLKSILSVPHKINNPDNPSGFFSVCSFPDSIASQTNQYINYPCGPLYNHNSSSLLWCEDVSNLATGLGYPTIQGTSVSYTDDNKADMYTINIQSSGNIGGSTFNFRISAIEGDVNDVGITEQYRIPSRTQPSSEPLMPLNLNFPNSIRQPLAVGHLDGMWYTSDILVTCVDNAIGLHNVTTDEYYQYDSFTTPNLPNISAESPLGGCIIRDDIGTIYIAYDGLGIVKITNPFSSLLSTVTTISLVDIGVTGNIRGMSHGMNDRLWLISQDGVFFSDDGASTWTPKPIFSNVGFAGVVYNVDNLVEISASPIKSDELVLSFASSANEANPTRDNQVLSRRVAWYKPSSDEIYGIDHSINLSAISSLQGDHIICDPVHGTWVLLGMIHPSYPRQPAISKFFSSVNTRCLNYIGMSESNPALFYDKLGNLQIISQVENNIGGVMSYGGRISGVLSYTPSETNLMTFVGLRYDIANGKHPRILSSFRSLAASDNSQYSQYGRTTKMVRPIVTTVVESNHSSDQCDPIVTVEIPRTNILSELPQYGDYYNYDILTSTWKPEFNAVTPDTNEGSSNAPAQRVNFPANGNIFSGRSYVDGSDCLTGVNFNAGMTLLASTLHELRNVNPNSSSYYDTNYSHTEEGTHTIWSLHSTTNNRGVTLLLQDEFGNLALQDNTSALGMVLHTIQPTGGLGSHRITSTISSSGDTVEVFVDGSSVAVIALTNPIVMDNTSSHLKLVFGSQQYDYTFNATNYRDLFKGSITNIQIFESVLSAGDISSDSGNPTGLVSSTNLLSRYLMSANYSETQTISGGVQPLVNSVTLEFADGDLSSDSFISGDYYNSVLCDDGILKGNVEKLVYNIDHGIFLDTANILSSSDDALVTAGSPITSSNQPGLLAISTDEDQLNCNYSGKSLSVKSQNNKSVALSQTSFDSTVDYSVEFVTNDVGTGLVVEFVELSHLSSNSPDTNTDTVARLVLNDTGTTFTISTNNTAVSTVSYAYTLGDKFRLAFVSGTNKIELSIHDGSNYVVVSSIDVNTPTEIYTAVFSKVSTGGAFVASISNIRVNYTHSGNIMFLGNLTTNQGALGPNFRNFNVKTLESLDITMDGTPAVIRVVDKPNNINATSQQLIMHNTQVIPPIVGEVLVYPAGFVEFNSADVGKILSVSQYSFQSNGVFLS